MIIVPSVQVYGKKDNKYVRIVESYRDPETKKPKIKVLQNLGRLDKLEEENPNILADLKAHYTKERQEKEELKASHYTQFIEKLMHSPQEKLQKGLKTLGYGHLVYEKLWNDLKLDYFFNYRQKHDSKIEFSTINVAKLLTYLRLLEPSSKLKNYQKQNKWFHLSDEEIPLHTIYRSLTFFASQKENLEKHLNRQLGTLLDRDLAVCFYDVTTYYFESQKSDDIKNFGFSKDNKVNQVQVVMGLLIDRYGIPITYELFPGNTSEFSTLEPVILRLKENYQINKIIITADRGLNSKANLARIRALGLDYVMAYKIRTASKAIKAHVIDQSQYIEINEDLKIKETELCQEVKLNDESYTFVDKFVLTYSKKRAAKDKKDRERLVEKAKKLSGSKAMMKSELKKGGKKYVQLSLEGIDLQIDKNKIEDDAQFDGYYGYVSSNHELSNEAIVDIYHGLWKIEESFRVLKTNLESRPIFVYTEESIRGHFVICYLALVIQRLLEYQLKVKGLQLSTERIQTALNTATLSLIPQDRGYDYFIKHQPNDDFEDILEALHLKPLPFGGRTTQVKL